MTVMTRRIAFGLLAALALVGLLLVANQLQDGGPQPAITTPFQTSPGLVARGAYLARAGNCANCHTARGGAPYAGGMGIETPFGTVFATNLTPDPRTGLGQWSATAFWRALHQGRSNDGRLLYPAFPYPYYTRISREDSDALYAYLQSLAPVHQPNRPHALSFPFNTQAALAVWRALYFQPETYAFSPSRSTQWNRGAYLVQGLGHCGACHSARNWMGATSRAAEFGGAVMPSQAWYAPSLLARQEAGTAPETAQHTITLLRTGVSPYGSAMGPMADVVFRSTQYLNEFDLQSITAFLQDLPSREFPPPHAPPAASTTMDRGKHLYGQHCKACHGDSGEGATGVYAPLAGNRAVTMASAVNVIQAVRSGGYPPTTAGNPRPYGMPPFGQALSDEDLAAVVTYIRQSWGNAASAVSALQVQQVR